MKWVADNAGTVLQQYEYGAWGSRVLPYPPPGDKPWWLDSNKNLIGDFPQMTSGQSGAAEHTPLWPALL